MIPLLLVATMTIHASGPPLPPAEAVRVLQASRSDRDRTNAVPLPADGPQVVIIPSSVTSGPFGEFRPFAPPRRLDGTLLSQPPWISITRLPRGWDHPFRGAPSADRSEGRKQNGR